MRVRYTNGVELEFMIPVTGQEKNPSQLESPLCGNDSLSEQTPSSKWYSDGWRKMRLRQYFREWHPLLREQHFRSASGCPTKWCLSASSVSETQPKCVVSVCPSACWVVSRLRAALSQLYLPFVVVENPVITCVSKLLCCISSWDSQLGRYLPFPITLPLCTATCASSPSTKCVFPFFCPFDPSDSLHPPQQIWQPPTRGSLDVQHSSLLNHPLTVHLARTMASPRTRRLLSALKPKDDNNVSRQMIHFHSPSPHFSLQYCFECNALNPQWASVCLGIWICLDCSGTSKILFLKTKFSYPQFAGY